MAVPGKLLTLKGVTEVANWGQELNLMGISIAESNENIIEKTREKMELYIEQAETIERKILETFGITTTNIEEGQQILQQKFIEILEKTGLINLSGPQLRTNVLNDYKMRKKIEKDDFERWVQTRFRAMVQKKVQEATNEVIKNNLDPEMIMSLAIVKALDIGTSNIKVDIKQDNYGKKVKKGLLYKAGIIVVKELSENRYKNLRKLYEIDTGQSITTDAFSETDIEEKQQDEFQESMDVKININYYKATGGRKASDLSSLSPEERKKELELIKQSLKNEIIKSISGEYAYTAYKILDRMLENNVEDFLVGNNINNIIGILGEFRAAVALTLLLPDKDLTSIIEWVAKEKVDNTRQLSIDFLLRTITGLNIGIQVKNSAQDLDNLTKQYEIHFVDANVNNVFDKLGKKYPIFKKGSRDRMVSKLIYISSSFNVPYKGKWENGKLTYINGDTAGNTNEIKTFEGYEDFCKTKEIINDIKEKINLFLKMFAPDFLFMSIDDNFKNVLATLDTETSKLVQGNNLYIIGNKPFFVSTILRKILDKIYQLDIEISSKYIVERQKLIDDGFLTDKGDKTFEGGNIIDYLNEFSTAEGGVDWQKIRKVSKNQNYQMTSSLLLS